jgi:hypothetical protein
MIKKNTNINALKPHLCDIFFAINATNLLEIILQVLEVICPKTLVNFFLKIPKGHFFTGLGVENDT